MLIKRGLYLPRGGFGCQNAHSRTFHPGIEAPKFQPRLTLQTVVALVIFLMIFICEVFAPFFRESCSHNERPSAPFYPSLRVSL
jgi:hypothetical protein